MGFWGRLGRVFRSNANAVVEKMEDPEKILNQTLLDMQDQLIKAKQQVAVAIADEKRLEKQYLAEEKKAKDWEDKARLALKAGNEELARKALAEKNSYSENANGYKAEWQKQKMMTDKLRQSLKQLSDKIDSAKRKKNLLIARSKRAKAQQEIQSTMNGLNDNSAFSAFDRMDEKVEQLEAKADATAELAEDFAGGNADLEKEFAALKSSSAGTDDDLAKLKAEMGLLEDKKEETLKLNSPE